MPDINNPTAASLMTRGVVSVLPETPVREIALILAERSISAVPVVDGGGQVLGVVTEADLVRRLAGLADAPVGWLSRLFADPAARAERYARTHGASARDIMTETVVSVTEDTNAADIAHLMEEKNIRRVLVMRDGQLAG
ncbi:MAG: CBS domain-containing protein, partial [Sphingopyxis sp.]|nr:CBS domain-containing protein [Sphingopyxis sp.]